MAFVPCITLARYVHEPCMEHLKILARSVKCFNFMQEACMSRVGFMPLSCHDLVMILPRPCKELLIGNYKLSCGYRTMDINHCSRFPGSVRPVGSKSEISWYLDTWYIFRGIRAVYLKVYMCMHAAIPIDVHLHVRQRQRICVTSTCTKSARLEEWLYYWPSARRRRDGCTSKYSLVLRPIRKCTEVFSVLVWVRAHG